LSGTCQHFVALLSVVCPSENLQSASHQLKFIEAKVKRKKRIKIMYAQKKSFNPFGNPVGSYSHRHCDLVF
jgi:hypothetical protein